MDAHRRRPASEPRASRRHARSIGANARQLFTSSVIDLSALARATNRPQRQSSSNFAPITRFPPSLSTVVLRREASERFSFDKRPADRIACLTTFIQA